MDKGTTNYTRKLANLAIVSSHVRLFLPLARPVPILPYMNFPIACIFYEEARKARSDAIKLFTASAEIWTLRNIILDQSLQILVFILFM